MELDPILAELATKYFANFTIQVIQKFFAHVFKHKPELRDKLVAASTPQEVEAVFREVVGVIDAQAGQGSIDVDGAFLNALRGIRFDHNSGTVTIQGTTMQAPILQTGGSGSGTTHISEGSDLKTDGTRISVGKGGSIRMSGNAKITQT